MVYEPCLLRAYRGLKLIRTILYSPTFAFRLLRAYRGLKLDIEVDENGIRFSLLRAYRGLKRMGGGGPTLVGNPFITCL